jgi:hypothetical protein
LVLSYIDFHAVTWLNVSSAAAGYSIAASDRNDDDPSTGLNWYATTGTSEVTRYAPPARSPLSSWWRSGRLKV